MKNLLKRIFHKKLNVEKIYDAKYHAGREKYRKDYNKICDLLNDCYGPKSVIDMGCSIGFCVDFFIEKHVYVVGTDGSSAVLIYAKNPSKIIIEDIRQPQKPPVYPFDLALCIEVAEHIEPEYADIFVENLKGQGQILFFTAAKPGQNGTSHVNLQPKEYWIKKLKKVGYRYNLSHTTSIRHALEEMNLGTPWIVENMMIFTLK